MCVPELCPTYPRAHTGRAGKWDTAREYAMVLAMHDIDSAPPLQTDIRIPQMVWSSRAVACVLVCVEPMPATLSGIEILVLHCHFETITGGAHLQGPELRTLIFPICSE